MERFPARLVLVVVLGSSALAASVLLPPMKSAAPSRITLRLDADGPGAVSRDCVASLLACYAGVEKEEAASMISEADGEWRPADCKKYFCEPKKEGDACGRSACEALCDRCLSR